MMNREEGNSSHEPAPRRGRPRMPIGALSGSMAAAILIAIALVLAAITVAIGQLLESSSEDDAEDAALRNATTFADVALDPGDRSGGAIVDSGRRKLREAARRSGSIESVILWEGPDRPRYVSNEAFGSDPSPPPASLWDSPEPSASLGEERIRAFLPVRDPEGGPIREVLEVQATDAGIHDLIGYRQGTALAIIAALAAVLYLAITPAAMRGAGALAERRRGANKGLQKEIRHAIDNGEIDLDFQPKVSLRNGRVSGVEALVRWRHPRRGPQTPLSFLPALERTEMIVPFTLHVVELALRRQSEWAARGLELDVAINVAPTALTETGAQRIVELIEHYGSAAHGLTIEMTETAITDAELGEPLAAIKQAGARLSIDDFGRGQSSLARLGSLPFDELKIDREFTAELGRNAGVAMVRTMIDLARRMGMTVVAEGVEWATTAGWLAEAGCDAMQGYLIAAPMEAAALERWLEGPGQVRLASVLWGPEKLQSVGSDLEGLGS